MNYNLGRKGIFVFTDAAGANAVLAIVDNLIKEGNVPRLDFKIYTNSKGVFKSEYNKIVDVVEFDEAVFKELIVNFSPDYIFTATSFNNYEHRWRKLASELSIKTYAFIDHWVYYYKRFSFDNETIFADEIWVINEIAKKEAIEEGLPGKSIIISGNPYYAKVRKFCPSESKKTFFRKHNLPLDKKIILFVSENIKSDLPKDTTGKCILGFDEYTIMKDLLESFAKLVAKKKLDFSKYLLVIKIHPISNEHKFDYLINKEEYKDLNIFAIKKIDPLPLAYYSDLILGMFSNLLIEALLLGKKVLRVQIGQKKDLFKFDEISCTVVRRVSDLNYNLENFIKI